jgi:hypothetical protein
MAKPADPTDDAKLSKSDPEFYSKIAKIAGNKLVRKKGTDYFSKLAASSHPRSEYHGGRPKKAVQAQPAASGKKSRASSS